MRRGIFNTTKTNSKRIEIHFFLLHKCTLSPKLVCLGLKTFLGYQGGILVDISKTGLVEEATSYDPSLVSYAKCT